jgi:hypothetical protein
MEEVRKPINSVCYTPSSKPKRICIDQYFEVGHALKHWSDILSECRKRGFKVFFFLILDCEAIGTAATPGLLCQPRVIVKMIKEKQMECRLAGETEVLGENLPHRQFCPSQNPTWPDPGLNTGRRGGKPATNRLSYGAASASKVTEELQTDWNKKRRTIIADIVKLVKEQWVNYWHKSYVV